MLADTLATMGANIELFHTASGTAFADLLIDGHRETWPVRSTRFRAWLRRRYYEATQDAPSATALNTALNLLEARAQFDGPERAVHVRVAEQDGHIFLDLADEHWRAVEFGPTGGASSAALPCASAVRLACCPLRFRNAAGRSSTSPRCSIYRARTISFSWSRGSWQRFDRVAPIHCWPFQANRDPPRPSYQRCCERSSTRTRPRSGPSREKSENCSSRPITGTCWHSTTSRACDRGFLMRFAGWRAAAVSPSRQLYTDQDEMLFDAARPVIFNGIEEVITRPDLADRSIFLTLPPVADAQRQSERELWRQFELAHPRILGALLDLVVHGLRTLPNSFFET